MNFIPKDVNCAPLVSQAAGCSMKHYFHKQKIHSPWSSFC